MKNESLFSLDRIEGELAVLVGDDGSTLAVPLSALSAGACEGKMYRLVGDTYTEDPIAEKIIDSFVEPIHLIKISSDGEVVFVTSE